MKDLKIKIKRDSSLVYFDKRILGLTLENLQGNIIFEFDTFVDGTGYLEIDYGYVHHYEYQCSGSESGNYEIEGESIYFSMPTTITSSTRIMYYKILNKLVAWYSDTNYEELTINSGTQTNKLNFEERTKSYYQLTKDDEQYTLPIYNTLLLKQARLNMQLRINYSDTAVFKSNMFYVDVSESLNVVDGDIPKEYSSWIDIINRKLEASNIIAGANITLNKSGNNITINSVGGGGGTGDYTQLINKPKINDVELDGNKTLSELGIDIPTKTSDLTNDSNFVVDSNYVHTDNNYTSEEKTKLAGISTNAKNVSVASTGTATDTVQYITIDGVEKKLAGSGGEPSQYVKSATIDDNNITFVDKEDTETTYIPDFSKVGVSQSGTATEEIGYITVDGTEYKIPHSESGEPLAYLKSAEVSGATLTLTNKDDSTVTFTKPVIDVSSAGTATDTVGYITIDGVEKKLAGEEYTAGTGIAINDNQINVDTNVIASVEYANTKSEVSASRTGTSIEEVKYLTIDNDEFKLATGATNYYSSVEPTEASIGDLWTYESGPDTDYVKSASINDNVITFVDQNDNITNYEPTYSYEGTYSTNNPIATKSYVDGKVSSALIYKGSCTYESLPTNPSVGDVWNVTDAHGTYPAGTNYAWNGTEWNPLGGSLDLSGYATTSQLNTGLATKQNTLTAGTGIRIANNVITNTVDSSQFATQEQMLAKLNRDGDTLGGTLVINHNVSMPFVGDSSNGSIVMQGGKYDGAKLRLNGESCSTETSQNGGFMLKAQDTSESCTLIGLPNRKLLWHNSMILTTDGGENINSPLVLSTNKTIAKSDVDNSYTQLYGGTDNTSAYLGLYGKNNSNSGIFALHAKNSSADKVLQGKPDGTLTWNGQPVMAVPTRITPTKEHSSISNTAVEVWKIGRLCTINITFKCNLAVAKSAVLYSGLPKQSSGSTIQIVAISDSGYRKIYLASDGKLKMGNGAGTAGQSYTINCSYVCQA